MTEQRPKPQYGEYASPEEQARAMGFSAPASMPAGSAPEAVAPDRAFPAQSRQAPAETVRPRGRQADRIVTYILLGVATASMLSTVPGYFDLVSQMRRVHSLLGFAAAPVPPATTVTGVVLGVTGIVLYLATVLLSALAIRAGRWSFYIPLVGGVVFALVTGIATYLLLSGDLAFIEYLRKFSTTN